MTFRITRKDTRKLQRLAQQSPQMLDAALRGVAEEMTGDIKLSFGTSPAGRTYTRGSVTHVASQPGYPPNVDTGTLRASMRWAKAGRLTYHIMDGVEYGVMLEFGTSRMAARPFIVPAFEDWRRRKFADFIRRNGIIIR